MGCDDDSEAMDEAKSHFVHVFQSFLFASTDAPKELSGKNGVLCAFFSCQVKTLLLFSHLWLQ